VTDDLNILNILLNQILNIFIFIESMTKKYILSIKYLRKAIDKNGMDKKKKRLTQNLKPSSVSNK